MSVSNFIRTHPEIWFWSNVSVFVLGTILPECLSSIAWHYKNVPTFYELVGPGGAFWFDTIYGIVQTALSGFCWFKNKHWIPRTVSGLLGVWGVMHVIGPLFFWFAMSYPPQWDPAYGEFEKYRIK